MQLPQLLLGLAATASAIDIYLHANGCYSNPAIVCVNAGPDWCCKGTSDRDFFSTVSFRAIPTDWTIQCRGHSGGNCNNLREVSPARNTRDLCLTRGGFSGAGYGFNARKRFAQPQECAASEGGCAFSKRADLLLLEDGTKYSISELDDAVLNDFIDLAIGGANATTIPAEFAALKVDS